MSLRKVTTLAIMRAQDVHYRLGVAQDFENWLLEIVMDTGLSEGYDYWFFDPQNINGPATTENVYLGINLCKKLSIKQRGPRGLEALAYFSQFPESNGHKTILGIMREITTG